MARQAAFDAALLAMIAFLVFATPLALGTVHVPTVSVFQWLVLVTLLLFVLRCVWVPPAYTDVPPAPRSGLRLALFGHPVLTGGMGTPSLLFVLLVLVQLIPLPPALLDAISPNTSRLYEASLPGYGQAGGVDLSGLGSFLLGPGHDGVVSKILSAPPTPGVDLSPAGPAARPVSVYPFATFNRLIVFLTFFALFFVAANAFRSRTRMENFLRGIVLYGFALAVFGIVQRLSWNGKIFWFLDVDAGASPFGPFINHNHFAAYLAMIVPVACGMLMDEARTLATKSAAPESRAAAGEPIAAPARRKSLFALHGPEPFARLLLAAFVVGVMVSAIVLSASRGAVLALGVSILLYGGALAVQGRISRAETVVAVVLLVVAASLSLWLGAGPLADKLRAIGEVDTEPSLFSRVVGWQWTIRIIVEHPIVGTGLGTFAEAWAHYYPPGTAGVWHEAHNDYLQLISETGAAGMVIFIAAFGIFAWRYLLPGVLARRRNDTYAIHGVVVGLAAVALHSIVDFPLQINACAVLFVSLSAILVAWRHRPESAA